MASALKKRAIHVLVVEDHAVNREYLQELLSLLGYFVNVAPDGESALEMLKARKPDIALIDIQMPKKDGLQLAKEIRTLQELNDLPLVAMTAYAIRGDKERFFSAGFDGYISKPFTRSELEKELNRLLGNAPSPLLA